MISTEQPPVCVVSYYACGAEGGLCRIQLIRLLSTFCVPSHVVIPLCVILFKSQNNLEGFLFVWVLWVFFLGGGFWQEHLT